MNIVNVSKITQKPFFFVLLGIALVGIPLTVYALLQQQIFQQNAWSTQQSASTECADEVGSAAINVSFANTETVKDMDVVANDLQTGKFLNLGTIKHGETKKGQIVTGKKELNAGAVLFKVTWTDKSSGESIEAASYKAISKCSEVPPPTNYCPTGEKSDQGLCRWDALEGALGYDVVVKDTQSGEVIKSESVSKDASQSAFTIIPGKSYQCSVTPTNICGKGSTAKSSEKICPIVTPTVTPTIPMCPTGPIQEGICRWDAVNGAAEYHIIVKETTSGDTVKTGTVKAPDTFFGFPDDKNKTYQCTVSAVSMCSETPPSNSPPSTCNVPTPTISVTPVISPTPTPTPSPTLTPTPTPSPTPKPTATPTPTPTLTPTPSPTPQPTSTPMPTPSPVVIVRTLTSPPSQTVKTVVQQQPGQPGQTVVQQSAPQTVVQTQQSQTFVQTTPVPTIVPTGGVAPTLLLVGTSVMLLLAGGIIFFIL